MFFGLFSLIFSKIGNFSAYIDSQNVNLSKNIDRRYSILVQICIAEIVWFKELSVIMVLILLVRIIFYNKSVQDMRKNVSQIENEFGFTWSFIAPNAPHHGVAFMKLS